MTLFTEFRFNSLLLKVLIWHFFQWFPDKNRSRVLILTLNEVNLLFLVLQCLTVTVTVMSVACALFVVWTSSVFPSRNVAETPLWNPSNFICSKKKRKTADGKRKPETEEISVTCAGIGPNQNSVPGHARRGGGWPVLGGGVRRWRARRRAAETSRWEVKGISSYLCAPLSNESHQRFCFFLWRETLSAGRRRLSVHASVHVSVTSESRPRFNMHRYQGPPPQGLFIYFN